MTDSDVLIRYKELFSHVFECSEYAEDLFKILDISHIYPAIEGERLLGGAIRFTDGKCSYIYGLCTHPDYRGRGIARSVLEDITADSEQCGEDYIYLVPQNEELYGMYRHLGFGSELYAIAYDIDSYDISTEVELEGLYELYSKKAHGFVMTRPMLELYIKYCTARPLALYKDGRLCGYYLNGSCFMKDGYECVRYGVNRVGLYRGYCRDGLCESAYFD